LPWVAWSLALGLGFLAKGPVAWLPLVPLLFGAFTRAELRPHRLRIALGSLAALVAAAALVLLWAWPALVRTDGEFFRIGIGKHVVHRSLDAFEGHGADGTLGYFLMLPFFFLTVFLSFFPASCFLPWLVRTLRLPGTRDPDTAYLLVAIATVFGVFTLVSTKLPHYTLPAFPALALVLVTLWFRSGRAELSLRKASIAGVALWIAVSIPGAMAVTRFFPSPQLLEAARPHLSPEMEFGSVSYEEPSLVWYFRKEVRGFHSKLKASQVAKYLREPGPRFVILPTADLEKAGDVSGLVTARVRGLNIVNGKRMDLTLLIKKG